MLAVSSGCTKMHMYIHGLSQFAIQTDHQPLIPILNNKMLVDMSPTIQRMKMTLLPYTFTAEHVKGTTLKDVDHQRISSTNRKTDSWRPNRRTRNNQSGPLSGTNNASHWQEPQWHSSPHEIWSGTSTIARSYAEGMATFHQRLP